MSQESLKLDSATRDELVLAYMAVQKKHEEQGVIPKQQETTLTRYQPLLEIMGAVHLGLLVAAISIVFNFILINLLLHLLPS